MRELEFNVFDFIEDAAVIYKDTFLSIENDLETADEKAEAYFLIIYNYLTNTLMLSENKHVNTIVRMCRSGQVGTAKRYKAAKENGAKGGAPKKYDDDRIVELRKNGYTYKQICDELGCCDSTVQTVMRKYSSKSNNSISDLIDVSTKEAVITSDNLKTNTNTKKEIKTKLESEGKTKNESDNNESSFYIDSVRENTWLSDSIEYDFYDLVELVESFTGYHEDEHIGKILNSQLINEGYTPNEIYRLLKKHEGYIRSNIDTMFFGESRAVAILTGVVKNKQPKPLDSCNEHACISEYDVNDTISVRKKKYNFALGQYEDDDGDLPF